MKETSLDFYATLIGKKFIIDTSILDTANSTRLEIVLHNAPENGFVEFKKYIISGAIFTCTGCIAILDEKDAPYITIVTKPKEFLSFLNQLPVRYQFTEIQIPYCFCSFDVSSSEVSTYTYHELKEREFIGF